MIMTRRHALAALMAGGGAGALVSRYRDPFLYISHFDGIMGTSLELRIRAVSEAAAQRAEKAVLAEIDRQSRILSAYDPTSEFSQWARTSGATTRVSPELADVLIAFDTWTMRTGRAIDASSEAIARVWQQAARDGSLPDPTALQLVVDTTQQRHWSVDRRARTATRTSAVPIALNSFTKSYVIDHAAQR
ncbi:MAG: FAD:protein FMN transferase, partial [Acidobacteriota bacterium]